MIKYNSTNLMTFIDKSLVESAATEFLKKYCPEALAIPMAIPIEEIIQKKMNLKIIYKNKISSDGKIFGLIAFNGGVIPLYDIENDEYVDYIIEPRTIVVDVSSNNAGQINNTLAHEAVHYFYHRKYFIRNYNDTAAIQCAKDEIEDKYLGLIEWQAKNLAPAILMPLEMVKKKADEAFSQKMSITIGDTLIDYTTQAAIEKVAEFFHVSKLSAYYRLSYLGYDVEQFDKDAKQIYSYYAESKLDMVTRTNISPQEIFELALKDKTFREVIDSGLFTYNNGSFSRIDEEGHVQFLNFCYSEKDVFTGTAFCKSVQSQGLSFVNEYNVKNAIKNYKSEVKVSKFTKNTFNIKCRKIIEKREWDSTDFWEYTLLSRNIFSQIKNEDESNFKLPIIIAILVGLQLSYDESIDMLKREGYALNDSSEHIAYKIILHTHLNIDDANEFLNSQGFKKLGTQKRKK